jgi:hypothetical protein
MLETLTIKSVSDAMQKFSNQETAVSKNTDWTEAGKQKELAKIAEAKQSFRAQVVATMIREFDSLLARFNANDTARKAAQNAAAAAWDYERLNYQARAAETKIKTADDLAAVEALYHSAKNSGDKHAFRAMVEVATDALKTRWLALEPERAHLLIKAMQRDLRDLMYTPELKAADERGNTLANEAIDLKTLLQAAHTQFGAAVSGLLGLGLDDELGWMMNSITQEFKDMGENGNFSYEIHMFDWRIIREQRTGMRPASY